VRKKIHVGTCGMVAVRDEKKIDAGWVTAAFFFLLATGGPTVISLVTALAVGNKLVS
jgi:hypothetical protein